MKQILGFEVRVHKTVRVEDVCSQKHVCPIRETRAASYLAGEYVERPAYRLKQQHISVRWRLGEETRKQAVSAKHGMNVSLGVEVTRLHRGSSEYFDNNVARLVDLQAS